MFCRSCWANTADGSLECPKCHVDPTVAPAAPPPTRRAGAPAATRPPKTASDRQNRLIALVALLVLLVAGPSAVEWARHRWRGDDTPPAPGGGRSPASRPALTQNAPTEEPSDPSASASPEAALLRDAYRLYQQGQVAEACDRYREAATRTGADEVRRSLASCLARLGREAYQADLSDRAVDSYQRAVEAYPENPALWVALAVALVKARDSSRALAVLEQAASRFPDDAEVVYMLAEVQERQGRTREAADTLRRLLARHPEHGRGKTLLASLEGEQKVEAGYWSQESRHFLVRYEGAVGMDVGRSVTDYLEDAYDTVGRALDQFPPDKVQVGIYREEVLGQVLRVPAHFIRGAFDGRKLRLNIGQSVAFSNDLSQLVRHEYTHLVIHELSKGRAPIWVHEGLAQVMEGRSPYPLDISVPREYLTVTGIERLARGGDPLAFTAGYILTHIAMEYVVDRGGMSRVREFLVHLGQGEPVDQALRQTVGVGVEDVESRLLAAAGRG